MLQHIPAPILAEISVQDLNQRYSSSFTYYRNQVIFILRFHPGVLIEYITSAEETRSEVFEWEALNTNRPPARWYDLSKYKFRGSHTFVGDRSRSQLAFLSYPPRRQWHRGFIAPNSVLVNTPDQIHSGTLLAVQNGQVHVALAAALDQADSYPHEQLDLNSPNGQVLRPYMAAWWYQHGVCGIFVRRRLIASIRPDSRTYYVSPAFQQELAEVWPEHGKYQCVGDV